MKIFEYQFNPRVKKDRFLKALSFEPQEEKSERKGNLYFVAELTNSIPSNAPFINKLAQQIKKEYYSEGTSAKAQSNPQEQVFSTSSNFKKALRKGNDFLKKESANGNTDWIGNLHIALIALSPEKGNMQFHFAKIGNAKVWMGRNGSLVDIGKKIETSQAASGAPQGFGNVVSGSAFSGDRILLFTPDLFDFFAQENVLQDLGLFNENKQFRTLFDQKNKELARISGIFFGIVLDSSSAAAESAHPSFGSRLLALRFREPSVPQFSLLKAKVPKMIFPMLRKLPFARAGAFIAKQLPHKSEQKIFTSPFLKPLNIVFKAKQKAFRATSNMPSLWRNILIVGVFSLLLFVGFAFFYQKKNPLSSEAQQSYIQAMSLLAQAETALANNNSQEANRLLQEIWNLAAPYTNETSATQKDREVFEQLMVRINPQLTTLNNIQEINELSPIFQIPESALKNPSHIELADANFYVFNTTSSQVYIINSGNAAHGTNLDIGYSAQIAASLEHGVAFFTPPAQLLLIENEKLSQQLSLSLPDPASSFSSIASFGTNLYFLDSTNGNLIKYSNPASGNTQASFWLAASSSKKPENAQSFSIDSNIWILTHDYIIDRYFKGMYEQTFNISVFPKLSGPAKIRTNKNTPNLYIFTPDQHRLLVLSKSGALIKQYVFPSLSELRDFTISEDGNTLYLLNGNQIYQLHQR